MQQQDNFSHQESLHLIEKMISAAKDEHRESGIPWLFWGSLLFGASVTSAVLMVSGGEEHVGKVWSIMLAAGSVLYVIMVLTQKRGVVKTYVEELLDRFETGFFISLFAMVAGNFLVTGTIGVFGFYYILYAFWLFLHGSAIRFRPLLIGAIANWIAAILIFIISKEEARNESVVYIMIISAIAILVGFLIPGYLLRKQYLKKTKTLK
jgi:hypothetical protein